MSASRAEILDFMEEHQNLFICPICGSGLEIIDNKIHCRNVTGSCGASFNVENTIPLMFVPHGRDTIIKNKGATVTDAVKTFYERTPFPNYDEIDSVSTLMEKARKGIYARLLDEQIPYGIRILEVGCGTGQLCNFLSMANRTVIGTDMSIPSLKLAQQFKEKHDLENAHFFQMNLFKPFFQEESFHLVMCSGVLHHTPNPYEGFKSIVKLTKRGGVIIIGLYNKYGRFFTKCRKQFFRLSGDRMKNIDPLIRTSKMGETRKRIWFEDQYKNPHESTHTIDEVLRWFDENGIEFITGIPKIDGSEFHSQEKLFKPQARGSWLNHILVQLGYVFSGSSQGGLFVMIGKRIK